VKKTVEASEKGVSPFQLGPKPRCTFVLFTPEMGEEVDLNLRFTRSAPLALASPSCMAVKLQKMRVKVSIADVQDPYFG